MTEFFRARWRVLVPSALVAAILVFAVVGGSSETRPSDSADEEDAPDDEKLRIRWVQPIELEPGEAVIVDVSGLDAGDVPVHARVSTTGDDKHEMPLLRRSGDRLVFRIPREAPAGMAKLRVFQGEGADERKSKPRFLQLRKIPLRDVLRDTLGGLALFVIGLYGLGRAFQNFAGQRIRDRLGDLTGSTLGAAGFGVVVGGLMQSTTSGAGVVVGLLAARMLSERGALTALLGVQLGAATAGALMPLMATRESLWIVLVGGVCIAVAGDRRMRAFGNIVLGIGLLLLGLRVLQEGLRPLVADPALLPYLDGVRADTPRGMLTGAGIGALLCALLQGPGPVFAVTASVAQTSGVVGLSDGIVILAGTALGAAVGTAAVGRAFGRAGVRLAVAHAALGLAMTVVMLAAVPGWTALAEAMVAGQADTVSYTGRVLFPALTAHLGVGFLVAQLAAVLVALALRGPVLAWAAHGSQTVQDARPASAGANDGSLLPALRACRAAVGALVETVETRERAPAVAAERAVAEARAAVEALLNEMPRGAAVNGAGSVAAASTCLHLASAIEATLQVAERALAHDFAIASDDAPRLDELQRLLVAGVDALLADAEGEAPLEIEDARAREIRLNALAESAALGVSERSGSSPAGTSVAYRLWVGELAVAYEALGNQVYRLANALVSDD